jgi:multiple antibiotic resistance protein
MNDALTFGALSFSSLLTMVNPLGAVPTFLAVTRDHDAVGRRRAAFRSAGVALGVLVLFAVAGTELFKLFGITLPAFRITGGILFFITSLPMLLGRAERDAEAQEGSDPTIVPLAVPLITGPGAISTVMVLMGQAPNRTAVLLLLGSAALTMIVTALVLWAAPNVIRRVGPAGIELTTRLMGLFMAVIGIQFIIDGIGAAMRAS